jgi:hypothetical protein
MKKIAFFALITMLAVAWFAQATEVADVAKKERERREAIQKQGKQSKVFTNQDIANIKSTLGFEVTAEPEQPQEKTLPGIDTSLGDEPEKAKKEPPPQQQQVNEETEKLKEERATLEQQAKDAQQTINQGGGYHTHNIGNQYKLKREAEARIREIDQELEEEDKKQDEQ